MMQNIFRINQSNCGDMASSPVNYFDFNCHVQKICIEDLCLGKDKTLDCPVIFGGGGLLYGPWIDWIKNFCLKSNQKIVFWGCGLNLHNQGMNSIYPKFIKDIGLVGVRDFNQKLRWVPCASCMSSLFDKQYQSKHEIVVYEHHERPLSLQIKAPKKSNRTTFEDAINFIASGEHVITNSYHGVYWATLLNKKIIAIPIENSSRFHFFKHQPLIKNSTDIIDFSLAKSYGHALEDCRDANRSFYSDVLKQLREIKIL